MKLLVAVNDGVGVRNFVLGRFLDVLEGWGTAVEIVSGVPVPALTEVAGKRVDSVTIHESPVYLESTRSRFLRKALEVAHQTHFSTAAMRHILAGNLPRGFTKGAAFARGALLAGRAFSSRSGIGALSRLHRASLRHTELKRRCRRMLEEVSPSLVFFTHQRPPQGFILALAARELGITTVAFIFSWDNLSSKGRVPVVFDHYLVWSNHMKRELLHFYPDVRPQNVHVVGTPQFEPYVHDEYGWSEAELCRRTRMRPECKRICFSAGDASTSPNDVHYLRTMAEMRRSGAFGDGVEIVVRPSPAEDGDRFNGVREEFPELVWCPPRWRQTRSDHPEPWSQRLPEADDIDLLKSLTVHCDVNVNMASTMTLDFGLAGKPVVNVAFGGDGGDPKLFDDFSYYRFEHYRPVIALGAARLARSPGELAEHVRAYLKDPDLDAEGRAALVDMQVDVPLRGTSERIVDALSRISEESA